MTYSPKTDRGLLTSSQSNNISAQQIQDDYANRQAEAARQANEAQRQSVDPGAEQRRSPSEANSPEDLIKKRKRQQAITRIKNSKEFAKRKARLSGDHDPEYDDESLANQIHEERQRPQPGQLANCEICEKRFTVTPYSKTGPGGGLLCPDCSKKHKADEKKPPAKKRATGNIGRRQNQTNLLDGLTPHGTQSLLETCIKVGDANNTVKTKCSSYIRKLRITSMTWKISGTCLRLCSCAWDRSCPDAEL